MPLIEVSASEPLELTAPAAVIVPLYGAHDLFKRCLRSLLRHTHRDVPIVIADDADPDPGALAWARELDAAGVLAHTVHWLRQPENRGFPGNCNAAFAATAPADVAVVNSDCEVAARWLDGLRSAAYTETNVASATSLTNHGTIVSVPYRNRPQPSLRQDLGFELAAARVREHSPRLHPRIPTLIGHCFYLRRQALQLVGDFDESFFPGYGEEVDFSQRCLVLGLQHVVADDVLVLHRGGASLSSDGAPNPAQARHEKVLRARYPWYGTAIADVESDPYSPLARSLAAARRVMLGLRITVDGRILGPMPTGTQVHVLEFIHALWRLHAGRVRVIVPADLGGYARDAFAQMHGIEIAPLEHALAFEPDDIVHRLHAVAGPDDLEMLTRLAERVVLSQLDLIAYRNPAYFAAPADWSRHRALTREALRFADLVLFSTPQALRDARADDLVDDRRARVVALGVDHSISEARPQPVAPETASGLAGTPFMLCLGTDFHHKNRTFALRVLDALRRRHGWEGKLVLAGPQVAIGSSAGEEAGWLTLNGESAEHVVLLPAVSEAEKVWLLEHATALLYPTTYEGFGFIPFEAAAAGVPCFFSATTSMADTLAGVEAVVVPWDADATADRAIDYLRDEGARARLVHELGTAVGKYTWERTARETLQGYIEVLTQPASSNREAARALALEPSNESEFEGRYWELRNEIGPTGFSLVGRQGQLPDDAQRALSALTKRRLTRGPVVGGLRLAHRIAGGSRHKEDEQG